ncbi:acyltransferase family protein [Paraburkholderia phenazinium]|uniref:Peptidoglycan/LPS O-acetylase OafA/YrhL, contains acyltransferase and SGNH-hydrolase domains n=1 Tax=Paraburkholderia phenazinium TaxID=60549 RepID=A0A1G8ESQ4_9BURK|nr:acyltransferase [Paraburkholderia phenazinium]SDH72769.1 Peptidoglycan/LPS O-acetylase OafA/YrhL, contains acyltransferase and SGNH-hydrolase domains [Paraburkholderia phenazinium]
MGSELIDAEIHGPWYVIPVLAVLLWLFSSRHFTFLDEPAAKTDARSHTIDGLRGFLALGVFFAHATAYHAYLLHDQWGAGPSVFFNQLGNIGVALFFIITAYLFWGKAIAAGDNIKTRGEYGRYLLSLYTARLFRIAPLYYFVAGVMFLIVLTVTGPHLNVTALQLIKEVCNWMLLGLGANVWINGYGGPPVMFGMVWTLQWEWYFYFSLAATSLLAFSRKLRPIFPVGILIASASLLLFHVFSGALYFLLFSIGMIFAASPEYPLRRTGSASMQSIAAAGLMLVVYFGVVAAHLVIQSILLAALFFLIMNGCDLFGLLKTRAAQRLGTISYSIYLTHGICLHFIFANAWLRAFALESATQYWCVVLLAALLVTGLSSMTFRFIEKPGITLGRSLLRRSGLSRSNRKSQSAATA